MNVDLARAYMLTVHIIACPLGFAGKSSREKGGQDRGVLLIFFDHGGLCIFLDQIMWTRFQRFHNIKAGFGRK